METNKRSKCVLLTVLTLIGWNGYLADGIRHSHRTCQEITIPMCKSIGYNNTYMPNIFNHETQEEAGLEVHQFWPLVEIQCSPDLLFFLCSIYTPICVDNYDKPLPACRSICERAKAGCAPLMKQYGFIWPERMGCEQFPDYGDPEMLCMDFNASSTSTTTTAKPLQPSKADDTAEISNSPTTVSADVKKIEDCKCSCRSPFLMINETSVYYNKVTTAGILNCALNCENSYFSADAHNFTKFWIGSWAILSCVSTLLTVITFLIDSSRFIYPERPIIILSACYFMVGVGYILSIMAGNDVVGCNGSTIHYGTTGPPLCTIVFLLVYFFGMAACIWWVILSLTWFLAAGLKWGQEAIASYSQYFHIIAWVLPSVQSIIVLAMSAVDGDPVSGICFVGNTNRTHLWAFVLIPLFIYLILGLSFLLAGFISLVGIRNTIKQQGEQKIKKLEKLMIKIGVFSIMYTVPATVVIACHLYEQHLRDEWNMSIACPCRTQQWLPGYSVFMLKYFMYHIVGITSGFWIWSGKTITAWRQCFSKLSYNKKYKNNDQYGTVLYRHAPLVADPSIKSLCPSQV